MELTLQHVDEGRIRAAYTCPCGCRPGVEYVRGAAIVEEGCCCGNHFAVGPHAARKLQPKPGFQPELQVFQAPWGEPLEAAWLIGPSVHGPDAEHEQDREGHRAATAIIDPVCGMSVEPDTARAKGLHSRFTVTEYFFCGKGCKLEFDDDPERYLDPSYVPSM
ncbi:hypothetical protein BH24CHL6_BH24CHL6_08050 [soil metagenome]